MYFDVAIQDSALSVNRLLGITCTMQLKLLNALMAVGLAVAAGSAASQVTDKMIQSEATTRGESLTWGLSTDGQRYSR
jgi:hypothetical protein